MGQHETVFRTDPEGVICLWFLLRNLLVKQLSIEQETTKTKVSETEWAAITHPSTVGGWKAVASCKRFQLFNRLNIIPYAQLYICFII